MNPSHTAGHHRALLASLAPLASLGPLALPRTLPSIGALLLAAVLLPGAKASRADSAIPATQSIQASALLKHIEILSSDDFEGRSVGSHGEDMTVDYLVGELKRLGLRPGNPDGSYIQKVPLTSHRSQPAAVVSLTGKPAIELRFPDDLVAWSYERTAKLNIKSSELVFVGYGVEAPEYDWDDFKGVDLKGKTLVMLINDPQIPDPNDPSKLDEKMFKGKAMTYYGRWTYKYEQALAHGAVGALIVHQTIPAAYPYSVVVNSWGRENFDIHTGQANANFPPVAGWIPLERAKAIFSAAGLDFDLLQKAALQRSFRPVPLHATIDFSIANSWRDLDTRNVVARVEGSDPKLKDEYVIYSAHWDHFGWDPTLPGSKHDQIFHGALDNASGVAALLELAKAFKALPHAPRRSILFIATTAEERGLLGAEYYATHPLYPLEKTLADINMDGMNPSGLTHDIEVCGYGNSDLDARLATAAKAQGRAIRPDSSTAAGYFYRADHFEFAKAGVPALYTKVGSDFIGKPAGFGESRRVHYTEHDYHKVSDVPQADWDLSGAVQDIELLFSVGLEVAQGEHYPAWSDTAEFKARRDRMMGAVH